MSYTDVLLAISLLMIVVCNFGVTTDKQIKWDGLRVTWGKDEHDRNFFVAHPRTEKEAKCQGFRKIADCDLNGPWRGKRYIKNDNYYVVLLFDKNGYIAGVQTAMEKNLSSTFPSKKIQPPFLEDGSRYVLTAYFTDPAKICTTGRTAEEFASEGTGTKLYIQNSTVPELSTIMPSLMNETSSTLWTRAKCFKLMGIHYYYDLRVDLDCNELFPLTLLYNNGELTAFAWIFLLRMPSAQFERTDKKYFQYFMDPVPTCMNNYDISSTIHFYLTDNATRNQC